MILAWHGSLSMQYSFLFQHSEEELIERICINYYLSVFGAVKFVNSCIKSRPDLAIRLLQAFSVSSFYVLPIRKKTQLVCRSTGPIFCSAKTAYAKWGMLNFTHHISSFLPES